MLNHSLRDEIVVVSGLPRSGTSMMMKMLEAGGIPPLTDHIRAADEDNPRGYYEFERVKKLREGDVAWLPDARGKAVKVIAALLTYLPAAYNYRVIFMRRAMPEVLASQRQMLARRGRGQDADSPGDEAGAGTGAGTGTGTGAGARPAPTEEEIARLFEKHLRQIDAWLGGQPNVRRIDVDYNALLDNPQPHLEAINRFLGGALDVEKMARIVDRSLHRQRA